MSAYSPPSEILPIFNTESFIGSNGSTVLTNNTQIITGQKTFSSPIISSNPLALTFSSDLTSGLVYNSGFLTLQYKDGSPFYIGDNSLYGGVYNGLNSVIALLPPGSSQYPSIQFLNNGSNSSTGFYCNSVNTIGISCNNNFIGYWSTTGLTIQSSFNLHLTNLSNSALQCDGGITTNSLIVSSTTASTSSSTGALQCAGGAYLGNDSYFNGNLQLRGSGTTGSYNGILTIGNSQNNSSGSWGQIFHRNFPISNNLANTFFTITSSGNYGGCYIEVIFIGTHNGSSGISAKAEIYVAMNGSNITCNTPGGSNVSSGSGTFAIIASASQGTIPLIGYSFASSQQLNLTLQCNNTPGIYDIYIRAFCGGSAAIFNFF